MHATIDRCLLADFFFKRGRFIHHKTERAIPIDFIKNCQ